jgi:H+-transporting ATPase
MQTPDVTGAAAPTIAETVAKLGADPKAGLTDAEVQARLEKYGPNALVEKQKNAFSALLAYFWGPIPWMIEAAALTASQLLFRT